MVPGVEGRGLGRVRTGDGLDSFVGESRDFFDERRQLPNTDAVALRNRRHRGSTC